MQAGKKFNNAVINYLICTIIQTFQIKFQFEMEPKFEMAVYWVHIKH